MNYPKINMILLIVVIAGLAAILYFLFINKKDTNAQTEALLALLGKGKSPSGGGKEEEKKSEEPTEPTEADWKKIYAVSEKIYNDKKLTKADEDILKKFPEQIAADVEFCKKFYPVVEKLMKEEELNENEKAFYEVNANKEQVDAEVEHRKAVGSRQSAVGKEQPVNNSEELKKSNPPLAIEERNKIILSLFEDGVPKSIPQIKPLYIEATGTDPQKNLYRIFGTLEGKFLTPYKQVNITYYCLPEWFDGRKLKPEFKNKI